LKKIKTCYANYQERFQYILVDEYQDTSGTQNRLVELLISYWDKPNVFVVGDDDQSIYRFQGANVENMLHFASNYKNDLVNGSAYQQLPFHTADSRHFQNTDRQKRRKTGKTDRRTEQGTPFFQ
jgi:superfamily I DNA/RNA helicase